MLAHTIVGLAAVASSLTAPGPKGPLAATYVDAGKGAPVILMIPGSGPTDRDGNNPLGVTAASYRLLAEALAERGVSTVRADKRGMFASKAAIADGNDVTIADYASDAHTWINVIRKQTGTSCVWLLGHSEGGVVALQAAQNGDGICGIILLASPGRKLGDVIREQLKANPANAPLLEAALPALSELEAGRRIDASKLPPPLLPLFNAKVQPFLIDLLAKDPPRLAAKVTKPVFIVQGGRDLQVSKTDADALHVAQPNARLLLIPTMNHVLKDVAVDDRAANLATYSDPSFPVDADLVSSVVEFVTSKPKE